jgi:hypothetical protein
VGGQYEPTPNTIKGLVHPTNPVHFLRKGHSGILKHCPSLPAFRDQDDSMAGQRLPLPPSFHRGILRLFPNDHLKLLPKPAWASLLPTCTAMPSQACEPKGTVHGTVHPGRVP